MCAYSVFNPTFPALRKPVIEIKATANMAAKQAQKVPLNPSSKPSTGLRFFFFDVMLAAMTAPAVRPTEFPI
jgi:hypothetical protein